MNAHTDIWTYSFCSTGLHPLQGRCPKSENYSILFKQSWQKLRLKTLQSCLRVHHLDKKCRSKPGRRFHLKKRAMVREFWLAEKEAEAKKKVDAKRGKMGRKESCPQKSNCLIKIAFYLVRIWPWKRSFAANLVLHLQ